MKSPRLLAVALAAAAALVSSSREASAANYSLYIHGYSPLCPTISRGPGQVCLSATAHTPPAAPDYGDFFYFTKPGGTAAAGANPRAVNWNGQEYVSVTNKYVVNALDCYCTGSNWCYIAAHSTGDTQIAYALDKFGGTTRSVKTPDSSGGSSDGTCQNVGTGATQTGWNIKWVDVAGGAAGGSELANIGNWLDRRTNDITGGVVQLDHTILNDLKPANARSSNFFNHNNTRGRMFYMFTGAQNFVSASLLPGQDDGVVAYHSAGGVSGDVRSYCNPWWTGDLFCDGTLTSGTDSVSCGWFCSRSKWTNHSVSYRDTYSDLLHMDLMGTAFDQQNWGELLTMLRNDMATYAQ